ncbi:hypothetical protein [Pararobbsia silviterrae]|nr:hypothetical protein [Pararobbsia silviterrae]
MNLKKALFCIGVSALLAACGGGDGSSTTPSQSVTQAQPLPSGSTYIATVSFGDTVEVKLDSPSTGYVTISFISSQFGLKDSLTGTYTQDSNTHVYSVSNFSANGSDVPAQLGSGASSVGMTFYITVDGSNNGVLSGQIYNVPNVKAGSGTLAGQLAGSNNGVTTVAGLAGTYSFIKLSGDYTSAGVPTGDQDADTGQIKINADGTFRACPSAPYSDTCTDDEDSSITDTGTITVDADQTDYPGAFDLTLNGVMYGRMFASTANGAVTLMLDQAGTNSDGTYRTGSWVLQTASTLVSGTYNGFYACTEPTLSGDTPTGGVTQRALYINGAQTEDSLALTLAFNTSFNAAASSVVPTPVAISGLMSSTYPGSGSTQSAIMFLPVSASNLYYLDEPNADGYFVMGLCLPGVPA